MGQVYGHEWKEVTQAFFRKSKELPSLSIDLTSLPQSIVHKSYYALLTLKSKEKLYQKLLSTLAIKKWWNPHIHVWGYLSQVYPASPALSQGHTVLCLMTFSWKAFPVHILPPNMCDDLINIGIIHSTASTLRTGAVSFAHHYILIVFGLQSALNRYFGQ